MNRQNTADPVSELFERVSNSIKKKELSLFLIVGVIGCIGTMSVFKKSFIKQASVPKNLSTIKIVEQAASVTPLLQNMDPFLEISGDFYTAKPIDFKIGNFNTQALYEVNFGDGQIFKGKASEISHTYSSEGAFDVELIIHYKDNSSSIFNTRVNISQSKASFLSSL